MRRRFDGLLGAMRRHRAKAGALAPAVERFHKVAASYRPGLFPCHAVADLPRTNNDLEQLFGACRHHERRATGRKTASPAAVLRGPVVQQSAAVAPSPPRPRGSARGPLAILPGWIGSAGGTSATGSISGAISGRSRAASGATPMPTSQASSSSRDSRLCRPSFFRRA